MATEDRHSNSSTASMPAGEDQQLLASLAAKLEAIAKWVDLTSSQMLPAQMAEITALKDELRGRLKRLEEAQQQLATDFFGRFRDLQDWRTQVDSRLTADGYSKEALRTVHMDAVLADVYTGRAEALEMSTKGSDHNRPPEASGDSGEAPAEGKTPLAEQLHWQVKDVFEKLANQETELSRTRQILDRHVQQCGDSRLDGIETELCRVRGLQREVNELKAQGFAVRQQSAESQKIEQKLIALQQQSSASRRVERYKSDLQVIGKSDLHAEVANGVEDLQDGSEPRPVYVKEREYAIEQNVYGLLMVPSKPVRAASWLLLLIHYTLVAGLSWMIFEKTYEATQGVVHALLDVCEDAYDAWDCSEPSLRDMMRFDIMDLDGDGIWSLPEARASGQLLHFQALHRIASQSAEILNIVAPAKLAAPNYVCDSLRPIFSIMVRIGLSSFNDTEQLFMSSIQPWMPNFTSDELRELTARNLKELDYCGLPPDSPAVFTDCAFPHLCEYSAYFPPIEGIGSEDIYANLTSQYYSFPKAVFEVLAENILRPCLLVDRDQCANAEIKSTFLREVPIWQDLDSSERVRRCRRHVTAVCPEIFEDLFESHAQRRSSVCGEPGYKQEVVQSPPRHVQRQTPQCTDDDSSFRNFAAEFMMQEPVYQKVVQMVGGIEAVDCQLATALTLCQAPYVVPNTSGTERFGSGIAFFEMVAQFCPDTCCYRQGSTLLPDTPVHIPIACHEQCFQFDKHGSPNLEMQHAGKKIGIHTECFGQHCHYLHRSEQAGFGNVRIAFRNESFDAYDVMRLVVYSDQSLYVNVKKVFSGGGPSCLTSSLQINETRVCAENLRQNSRVFVPLKTTNKFEILFRPSVAEKCTDSCEWDILVSDAGERGEYALIQASFAQQVQLGKERGVKSWAYVLFFSLNLIVWVMFMFSELIEIKQSVFFILEYPAFGSLEQRALLLMTLACPRTLLWAWVLYVGVMLLTIAEGYVEMVLNSVALVFILDVDEVLYDILVPPSVKKIVENVDTFVWPARIGGAKISHNVEKIALTPVIMVMVTLFVIWEYYRKAGFLQMGDMIDCLCLLQGEVCASGVLN